MNSPLVSVIIPTYNRAHLIGETLDSVLVQSYINWECIVVDDGSTDETALLLNEYCEKDARFQYQKRPNGRPKGANVCRNYGFELSKGEYVNWFDDDDVMLEDFIKIKFDAFTPNIDLVICSGYFVDDLLQNRIKMLINNEFDLFKNFVLWRQQTITNSVLFRKSFLENKELFSIKIVRGQEAELFSRLFFQLPKETYSIVNSHLFLYRQHADTITARNNEYIKSFRESESYIAFEYLKKSIQIKDLDLIQFNYARLIGLFFKGIENNHFENSNFILKSLLTLLSKTNKKLYIELFVFGYLFTTIKRGSFRIEKRLKNYKFV